MSLLSNNHGVLALLPTRLAARDPEAELEAEQARARDLEAQLERAQEFGIARFNDVAAAHSVLDAYDPDPHSEPGELLHERLRRVLAPRLTAVEN